MSERRLTTGRLLPLAAAALSCIVGCNDRILGVGRPLPLSLIVTRDTLAVGDSVAAIVTVFDGQNRVERRPSYRLTVSDSTVVRLRGVWLVGRRVGEVVVRAESQGESDQTTVVVR